jgi:hypothetical protein
MQTKGLDFYYQHELTQEQKDQGDTQPENGIGSYAAYYKNGKSGDFTIMGGKNYRTGKAFHIFRPKITDDSGWEVWGEMNINESLGTLTITIPQDFLDKAIYPVTVDPTFGLTTSTGINATSIENIVRAQNATTSETSIVTSIAIYSSVTTANKAATAAIYAFTAINDAGSILATSTQITATSTGGTTWRVFTFNVQPTLTASTQYFLAAWSASGSGVFTIFYDDTTGGIFEILGQAITYNANAFPNPLVESSANANLRMSIYATYTASAPPPATVGSNFIKLQNSKITIQNSQVTITGR